jgi:outer membrane protein OmpA-like peptidoglycan-associated protein
MARVSPADALRLTELAAQLASEPDAKLLVRGHADGVGSDAANLALSFQRAEAVAQRLIEHGIERRRISVQGFGEYAPVDGTGPSESVNRRATIDVRGSQRCPTGEIRP